LGHPRLGVAGEVDPDTDAELCSYITHLNNRPRWAVHGNRSRSRNYGAHGGRNAQHKGSVVENPHGGT
jgi:hypothetical protein